MHADTCTWITELTGVCGHRHGHLSINEVRHRTIGAQGGIKEVFSDHGEYKQKDSKSVLRPLNQLHTVGELGMKDKRKAARKRRTRHEKVERE